MALCGPCPSADAAPDQSNAELPPVQDAGADAWVAPTDQQSCQNAMVTTICDPGMPGMTVTSAPGGPLLEQVKVTSGACSGNACSEGCNSLAVTGTSVDDIVGATCDLVATSMDSRSQSIHITVVANPSPAYACCSYNDMQPSPGVWVTLNLTVFSPNTFVVDFTSGTGIVDGGTGDAAIP